MPTAPPHAPKTILFITKCIRLIVIERNNVIIIWLGSALFDNDRVCKISRVRHAQLAK